jgi:hypothetical protein
VAWPGSSIGSIPRSRNTARLSQGTLLGSIIFHSVRAGGL